MEYAMSWNELKDLSDEGEQQYGDIGDLTSDKIWYRETKGIEYWVYGIIEEFRGIHRDRIVFQNPLLIIVQRGVSIMSGYSPTRRVSHLRVYDA
jgi:hypothetical protein